jgi:hypothetical protein
MHNAISDMGDRQIGEDEIEEDEVVEVSSKRRAVAPKQKGLIDGYFTPTPEEVVRKRKYGQTTLDRDNPTKKEFRERACSAIARWFYDAGIAFNAAKYEGFATAIEAIGQYGLGMKPPSYHELRVPLLKKEVDAAQKDLEEHKKEWEKNGCTIMSDGWKNKRERTLINFLVNSSKGTVFMRFVDASAYSKTGDKMFELLRNFIEEIGPSNVVQVVTDSASNNVLAGNNS